MEGIKKKKRPEIILWHILGTFLKKWLLLTVLPFFLPLLFPFDVEQGASVDQDQPLQGVGGVLSWKEFGSLTMRCTIPAPGLFFSVIYTNPNWYIFQFHQMLGGAYSGEVGRDNVRARKEFKIPHTALASMAQWIGQWPVNWKFAGSITGQGTCLGYGAGSQLRVWERQPHTEGSLSFSFLPPLSKKINK